MTSWGQPHSLRMVWLISSAAACFTASSWESGRQLSALAAEAQFQMKQAARGEKYVLRIGSSLRNPSKVLTDLWEPLRAQHRAFQFTVVPYDDDRASLPSLAASLGREIDLLVGAFSSQRLLDAARFLPLGQYPLCVAVSAEHPLAQRPRVRLQELYGERLLIRKGGDAAPINHLRAALQREHPQIQVTDTQRFYDIDIFNLCEQTGAGLPHGGCPADLYDFRDERFSGIDGIKVLGVEELLQFSGKRQFHALFFFIVIRDFLDHSLTRLYNRIIAFFFAHTASDSSIDAPFPGFLLQAHTILGVTIQGI